MMSNWEATSNHKWEYKAFHCFLSFNEYRVNNGIGTGSIEVSEFLNMLGEEGWELVSTMQKVTDYEQILGGSGHPVGIKAHKNTSYEFIMKRQLVRIATEQEISSANSAVSSENTASLKEETVFSEETILDNLSDDDVIELSEDISIEDLTEASKNLAEEVDSVEDKQEEATAPLLEGPFYSGESTSDPSGDSATTL